MECGQIRCTESRTPEGLLAPETSWPVWQGPGSATAPHWVGARRAGLQGLQKRLAQACQASSLHLALFIGSVPLNYSRILSSLPPFQSRPCDAQQGRGAGEGLRLSSGPSSVWISTHDRHVTATFKTVKAAGSFNVQFPRSRCMGCVVLPRPCHHLRPRPARDCFY